VPRKAAGSETTMPKFDAASVERFWTRIRKPGSNDCWAWTGALTEKGYGRFSPRVDGRSVHIFAHRFAFEATVGPIPAGLQLDHLCRNRACVNPAHLEPVDARTNLLRGETEAARNAAKVECLRGHPFDTANTYVTPNGRRQCRICRNAASRRAA
jgi:hypothetical protein